MATCKDCLCYEACKGAWCGEDYQEHLKKISNINFNNDTNFCDSFKDKDRYIELPCKVGDTVYIKNIPLKISFIAIDEEIRCVVQFDCNDCSSCPFYEDDVSFEGEHDCKTNGYIEFCIDDIGKTIFLTKEEAEKALKELNAK